MPTTQTRTSASLGRGPSLLGTLYPLPPPHPPGSPYPSPAQPAVHSCLQQQHHQDLQQLPTLPLHPAPLARGESQLAPHPLHPRRRDSLHRGPRRARPHAHRYDPHPGPGLPRVPPLHLPGRGHPLPGRAPPRAHRYAVDRRAAHRATL